MRDSYGYVGLGRPFWQMLVIIGGLIRAEKLGPIGCSCLGLVCAAAGRQLQINREEERDG